MKKLVSSLAILVAFSFVAVGCGPTARPAAEAPSPAAPTGAPQPARTTVRDQGAAGVTVTATWVGIQENQLVFRLAFDTHSVDLSRFDVAANVALRDDSGRELSPAGWEDERRDSHHRAGTLRFPAPDGPSRRISLVVRNLAGISERVLTFELRI